MRSRSIGGTPISSKVVMQPAKTVRLVRGPGGLVVVR
jgi:hypothetical protein